MSYVHSNWFCDWNNLSWLLAFEASVHGRYIELQWFLGKIKTENGWHTKWSILRGTFYKDHLCDKTTSVIRPPVLKGYSYTNTILHFMTFVWRKYIASFVSEPLHYMWSAKVTSSCKRYNIGRSPLPDMYAQCQRVRSA